MEKYTMDKLPIIEMAEISNYIVASDSYQGVFTITELETYATRPEKENDGYTTPVRLNALAVMMVSRGEMNVNIDFVSYTLKANCFLAIMPSHVFQVADFSSDFKATLLMVDKHFIEDCNPAKRSPNMTNFMLLRRNPMTVLLPEETQHITNCMNILREKIRLRTHSFHKEVMQNALIGFLLELGNIFVGKSDSIRMAPLSRKEEIMNNFLQLLFVHAKEEHGVTYYAEKLFISPQYLSLVLKELSGKSANVWIDEALMMEAKILLKSPNITVQQVADQLNFSDQSTFGKFFKKHIGLSPMEYRKSK
ncbi:helix-turn-helix domain-containing protein [Parabacteroides sp. OttesenSCG-928-N08]|nr:helix-turn-helix domain-containing protein [Parabacteroides sp. OttesenSCG-928-N08]